MKKIVFVIVYFGKLPNYFDLWLTSAKMNSTVNFLLVTDDKSNYNYPKNVKVIYSNFKNVQTKIKELFNFETKIKAPYKLCDYKPFYNLIFEEEIKKYDFWGYCDIDLMLGDIRKFITEEILKKYSKLYIYGHMTIMKNNESVNKIIMSDDIFADCYNYKEALQTNYVCHFDEKGGISKIFSHNQIEQYDNIDFVDLNIKKNNFQMLFMEDITEPGIFEMNNGKLYFITNKVKKEIIYAHFQKRKMAVELKDRSSNKFLIIPNKFIDYIKYDEKFIKENQEEKVYWYYYKRRMKTIIGNIKNGALIQRMYRLKKKIKLKKYQA